MARAARKRQGKQGAKRRGATGARAARPRVKRRAATTRAARAKSAARRGAGVRTAGKAAGRKRAPARATRKAATRKAATRKAATRKRATRAAARRPAAAARAPRTAPVPRRAAPPRERAAAVPQAFSAQRAAATVRDRVLFELARARASVKAAIQGLSAGAAMQPVAPGKWSAFEIVLHLSERDRVRLEEFGRTLGGQTRSWAGIEDPEMAAVNEAHLAPLRAHTWDEAVRRLDSLREELMLRLREVPAFPDDVWQPGHSFGAMFWGLPDHDRHHAEQIKRARIAGAPATEESDV